MRAALILENGAFFEGEAVYFKKETCFELVFNTSMVGYTEIITDPAYMGQGIVMTYPLIGNYGVNTEDFESDAILAKAIIVRRISERGSNFRCEKEFISLLKERDVSCLAGIDTRRLTRILRTEGAMRAMITDDYGDISKKAAELKNYKPHISVFEACGKDIRKINGSGKKIAVLDLGVTKSVTENLTARNAELTVFPADTKADVILKGAFDGIFISSGPENTEGCESLINEVKLLKDSKIPIFAIGFGHQVLAMAGGGSVLRLKSVHGGANHPVMDTDKSRVYITNQNQRYTVNKDSLGESAKITHMHINDKTVEGIRYLDSPAVSVSFYPDSNSGVSGTAYLYDEFFAMAGGTENAKI